MNFILLLIICIVPAISSNYYSPYYTPYENCIINLNYSTIDRLYSLTNQSHCINKPHVINNVSFPETCTIGTGHAIVLKMIPIAHGDFNTCKLRSIFERDSLTTAWNTYSHEKHNFIKSFIYMLNYFNYSNVIFYGDSVTVQLASFLGCDLLRNGVRLSSCGTDLIEAHKNGGCTSLHIPDFYNKSNTKTIHISSIRAILPCIWTNCSDIELNISIHNSFEILVRTVKDNSLFIFNYGLHIFERYNALSAAFARGLLYSNQYLENNTNNSLFLFRETSSQSFSNTIGGYFNDEINYDNNNYCCVNNHKSNASIDFRDDIIYQNLNKINKNWKSKLGWISFFKISRKYYDLHIEKAGKIDCTHYIYSPVNGVSNYLLKSIIKTIEQIRKY